MKTPIISSPIIIVCLIYINSISELLYAQNNKDFSKHNLNSFHSEAYEEQTATKVDTALINKYFQMSRSDVQPKVSGATYNTTNVINNIQSTSSNIPNFPNNRYYNNYYGYNYVNNVTPYLYWNLFNGLSYGPTIWNNNIGRNNRRHHNCWR